jgi:peptide deformylase
VAKLLQIAQLGNPILRKRASSVGDVSDGAIQSLMADMQATMEDASGVGIAAPQVYESPRIIIISSRPNIRYPHAPRMGPVVMVNPEIEWASDEMEKSWEGCLSIPSIRGLVPRNRRIQVQYLTKEGKLEKREFADFVARVFQHELDHLNGIVFTDRLETPLEMITEKEYMKIIS